MYPIVPRSSFIQGGCSGSTETSTPRRVRHRWLAGGDEEPPAAPPPCDLIRRARVGCTAAASERVWMHGRSAPGAQEFERVFSALLSCELARWPFPLVPPRGGCRAFSVAPRVLAPGGPLQHSLRPAAACLAPRHPPTAQSVRTGRPRPQPDPHAAPHGAPPSKSSWAVKHTRRTTTTLERDDFEALDRNTCP